MKLGQQAFFYHSNCKEPGIVGIVKVSASFSFCVSGGGGGSNNRWVIKQLVSPTSVSAPKECKRCPLRAANEPRASRLNGTYHSRADSGISP